MPIGILNPADVTHSVTVRPAYILGGVNQRRYYSDDLGTLITQQDFNQLKEQILYAADYYAISDIEGDDTLLRQIIAAGAGSLTGNLLLFQGLVGSTDKVPYFAGASSMDLMTVTPFSRSLLSKTAASQWRDALGISAALSGNVVALGNLVSAADLLPFFNGVESMQTCAFKSWGRGLVGQIDAVSARTYMGLGSAATRDESYFLSSTDLSAYALLASPAFTGNPTAPTQLQADNTTKLSTTSYVRSAIAALAATLALIATSGSASDLVAGTVPAARLPTSLSTIHILTPATDRVPYYASSSTAALATLTAFGRALIDDIDAPTARGTLGLGTAAVRSDTYFAPIDSPTFTGTPAAVTPSAADSSTRLATTAFVAGAVSGATSSLATIATSGSATDLITGTVPAARLPSALSTLHGLVISSNQLAYYTGVSTAALTGFTAFARTLLDDADAPTMRTTLGLAAVAASASAADLSAGTLPSARLPASLSSVYSVTPAADLLPYYTGPSTAGTTTLTAFIRTMLDDVDAPAVRVTLGLATIAVSASASDLTTGTLASVRLPASLSSVYALTPAADRLPYYTSASVAALATFTSFARTIVDDPDAATVRTTLGLSAIAASGSASDLSAGTVPSARLPASLSAIYALTPAADGFPYYTSGSAAAIATLSPFARTLLDDASAAAVRATLGVPNIAGDTFTGPVIFQSTIVANGDVAIDQSGAGAAALLTLRSDASQPREIVAQTGTLNRWLLVLASSAAETGGNVGSDFRVLRYGDTGSLLDVPFSITRSTGIAAFLQIPTAPTATVGDSSTNLATTAFVTTNFVPLVGGAVLTGGSLFISRTGEATTSQLLITGDASQNKKIVFRTGPLNRWQFYSDSTAESGLNAGSDFQCVSHPDDGSTGIPVFSISRATQIFAFAVSPTAPTPTAGDNSTKLSTTAFVTASFAKLASPTFSGTVTAPTITATTSMNLTRAAGNVSFSVSGAAGATRDMSLQTVGLNRWSFRATATAESGSNAGSNFSLFPSDDSGVALGTVLTIARATRILDFTVAPTSVTPSPGDNSTTVATTAFVAASFAPLAGAAFTGAVSATDLTANAGNVNVDRVGDGVSALAVLSGDAGSVKSVNYRTGTSLRWQLSADASLETGSNAGSDFGLSAYSDSAVFLGKVFSASRATRICDFTFSPTAPTPAAGDSSTKIATTAFVDTNFANLTGATFTGQITATTLVGFLIDRALSNRDIRYRTGGVDRWGIRVNNAAEGGSNAGSDFQIFAFNDAGGSLGPIFTIARSSQVMAFVNSPTAPTPAANDSSLNLATTAYVQTELTAYVTVNAQSGTAITVVVGMYGALVTLNNAGAQTCALPSDATLAVPIGTKIDFMQIGAGQCTFSAGSGATVTSRGGLLKTLQWGIVRATKRAANTWVLSSDGLSA